MKCLMLIKHSEAQRSKTIPPALMEAMGTFVQEGFKSGVLKDTAGLKSTAEAMKIRQSGGKLHVDRRPVHRGEGSRRRLCDGRGEIDGGSSRGRSPVHGDSPEALAGVRGRVRSASARRHVEPGDSARGGGWKSLRPPCSAPAALSECRACCISRRSRSWSRSSFASPRFRQHSAPLNRQPTTASPPNGSPASIDCCSSTSTRIASPAPSGSCFAMAGRCTSMPSAGATRKRSGR